MNDSRKGTIYGLIFLLFLIFLIVGGYFLTKSLTRDTSVKEPTNNEEETPIKDESHKIDAKKDYIYFENIDILSEKEKILYQDVRINFDKEELSYLEEELNKNSLSLKEKVKRISEQELTDEEMAKILYKDDDIYEANHLKYTRFFSEKYASLVIDYYTFNCMTGNHYEKSKSYVISLEDGSILTNEDLMKKLGFTITQIKDKVKSSLEKTMKDDDSILLDETLASLDKIDNYALYINRSGYFVISYLVKSSKVDYNDVIILN